jgi:hypothetical protein
MMRLRLGIGPKDASTHVCMSSSECFEITHAFITFAE